MGVLGSVMASKMANQMVDMIRDVFSDPLTTTFFAGAIIMFIGVVIAIFIRAIPLVSANDQKQAQKQDHPQPTEPAVDNQFN